MCKTNRAAADGATTQAQRESRECLQHVALLPCIRSSLLDLVRQSEVFLVMAPRATRIKRQALHWFEVTQDGS